MTPKQILAAHIAAEHRRKPPASCRTRSDLARWHAHEHWRYGSTTHFHEEDGQGALAGINTDTRRPSGWYTGLGSKPIQRVDLLGGRRGGTVES